MYTFRRGGVYIFAGAVRPRIVQCVIHHKNSHNVVVADSSRRYNSRPVRIIHASTQHQRQCLMTDASPAIAASITTRKPFLRRDADAPRNAAICSGNTNPCPGGCKPTTRKKCSRRYWNRTPPAVPGASKVHLSPRQKYGMASSGAGVNPALSPAQHNRISVPYYHRAQACADHSGRVSGRYGFNARQSGDICCQESCG